MPSSELPVEVAEKVIDAVAGYEHRATLLACHTICHTWLPRARWHLYQNIGLSLREDLTGAFLFVRTIRETPHLAELVGKLILGGPSSKDYGDAFGPLATGFNDPLDPCTPKWYDVLELPRLRNVRTLRLEWSCFDDFDDILKVLAFFPLLDHLSISRVHVRQRWTTEIAARVPPLLQRKRSISRLEIGFARFALPLIMAGCAPGGMFARVAHLDLQDLYQVDASPKWLCLPAVLHGTLETFRAVVKSTPHRGGDEADETPDRTLQLCLVCVAQSLHGCPALRSLLIRYYIQPGDALGLRRAPFVAFVRELGTLPALRELTLFLDGRPVSVLLPGLAESSAALAETLHDRRRFPALARLVVRVKHAGGPEDSVDKNRQEAQVRAAFAKFREHQHVELVVEVE